MQALVECVPNFSEGRDRSVIDAISRAISGVSGVRLLDVDAGADTNRTVYTFVGAPEAVSEAAFRAAVAAGELIDMSKHEGAHPRMGALDVCPIVPISGVTMDQCVATAQALGRRLAEALALPVYFYEYAATRPERRNLADIRAGEYEGLREKLAKAEWAPDAGPAAFNERLGASVVGAREFLIAYNVNVNSRDQKLANEVALNIREAGRLKRDAKGLVVTDAQGRELRVPGRLKAVKAIGWYIEQYRQAQVSINLLSYRTTPLHEVFETTREEAGKLGLVVTGSELVGMTPLEPMLEAGRFYLKKQGRSTGLPERELVEIAVQSLGLAQLSPFDPDKRIIEYAVRVAAPLVSMTVERFVDEVSSNSPAPGGGSVAALAGSLGAALAAMVANLTVGKAGLRVGVGAVVLAGGAGPGAEGRAAARRRRRYESIRRCAGGHAPAEGHRGAESGAGVRDRGRLREGDRRSPRHGATLPAGARAHRAGRREREPELSVGRRRRRAARQGRARRGAHERAHQPAVGEGRRVQDHHPCRDRRTAVEGRGPAGADARHRRSEPIGAGSYIRTFAVRQMYECTTRHRYCGFGLPRTRFTTSWAFALSLRSQWRAQANSRPSTPRPSGMTMIAGPGSTIMAIPIRRMLPPITATTMRRAHA